VHRGHQVVGPSIHLPRSTSCHAFKEPREELSPEEVEEWNRCAETLVSMGVGEEAADKILKESFGWCAPTSHARHPSCILAGTFHLEADPAMPNLLSEHIQARTQAVACPEVAQGAVTRRSRHVSLRSS
jgi:hypothetical protein